MIFKHIYNKPIFLVTKMKMYLKKLYLRAVKILSKCTKLFKLFHSVFLL